jgi:hypothetical protein
MNKQKLIPALLLIALPLSMDAQEQVKLPSGIIIAFKAGNAAELSKHLNATVEILLLDKEDFYKKNVAEAILRDFFTAYQAKDFVIRHQGSRNDAQYAIGNLVTAKGEFRVYLLLKKTDGELLIHLIRIEPENGN